MFQQIRVATLMLLTMTILTGGVYPALVTLIAQTAFSDQANGSLIRIGDQVVGSALIGQSFASPEYFWSRLSATGPAPYNAAASSGSNLGPLNPAIEENALQRIEALKAAGDLEGAVPIDLVTSSGSGLDPHISPAAAELQILRVAKARQLDVNAVRSLIEQHTEGRTLGVLGEPRVNVLQLNLSLDRLSEKK